MEHARLGRTGLRVSPLCLGTMNFGPLTSESDSFAIMDRALELGINFFDTANVYGGRAGKGATEEIIGRWLEQGDGRRERVVLATKVYGRTGDWPNHERLSAWHIRAACDDSLRRLRTDRIDLYQMHHVDRDTPWEEIWQAMEQLVQSGKVLYVGSSNFAAWHIVRGQAIADRRNSLGLVSEQSLYNLAARQIELEVLPACRELGIGLLPWSPLNGGMLGGDVTGEVRKSGVGGSADRPAGGGDPGTIESRRASDLVRDRIRRFAPQLEAWEAFCLDLGEEPAIVALAWLLSRPGVTAPIVGPRTMEQLDGSLRALEFRLDEAALTRLDEIWPGPGGAAPEAYAW